MRRIVTFVAPLLLCIVAARIAAQDETQDLIRLLEERLSADVEARATQELPTTKLDLAEELAVARREGWIGQRVS